MNSRWPTARGSTVKRVVRPEDIAWNIIILFFHGYFSLCTRSTYYHMSDVPGKQLHVNL